MIRNLLGRIRIFIWEVRSGTMRNRFRLWRWERKNGKPTNLFDHARSMGATEEAIKRFREKHDLGEWQ